MKLRTTLTVIVLGLVTALAFVHAAPDQPALPPPPALPGNAKPLVSG